MIKNTRTAHYQRVINKGIAYIRNAQQRNGSFASLTAADGREITDGEHRSTTFHASLILGALSVVKQNPVAKKIATSAIRFLLLQKSADWSWNYWTKKSPEYSSIRIPDDLDDTFVALTALDIWQSKQIDERVMLAAARILMAVETAPGGPYNTWIIDAYDGTPWEDVDLGVNANVMHFLKRKEIILEGMTTYFEQAIKKGKLTSLYYSPPSLIYLITKWYRGSESKTLLRFLFGEKRKLKNSLNIALFTTAHLRLGGDPKEVEKLIKVLKSAQRRDGSWDAALFFIEQIKDGIPQWSGSTALATACVIEALSEYELALERKHLMEEKSVRAARAAHITKQIELRFADRSTEMRKAIKILSTKIVARDELHEIALLPSFFAENMRYSPKPSVVSDLCAMNLFGWIGYTVCDKILDGEDAINMLPVATICIREVSLILRQILTDDRDYALATEVLDFIDETNFWEHSTCKLKRTESGFVLPKLLPDYRNNLRLAEKSLGHILGPLALVLTSKGTRAQKLTNAKMLRTFFEHYLIARQLNDDAHDWNEDLKAGFLNGASIMLMREWRKRTKRNVLALEDEQTLLDQIFWHSTIDIVARDILTHSKKARVTLKRMTFLKNTGFLEALLAPLERSAEKAIAERNSTVKILALCKD